MHAGSSKEKKSPFVDRLKSSFRDGLNSGGGAFSPLRFRPHERVDAGVAGGVASKPLLELPFHGGEANFAVNGSSSAMGDGKSSF